MELYTFPARTELLARVHQVWPEPRYKALGEAVAEYAGITVLAEALPGCLSWVIEDFASVTERGAEFRAAAYASLPTLIRALSSSPAVQGEALNEYLSLLARLRLMSAESVV